MWAGSLAEIWVHQRFSLFVINAEMTVICSTFTAADEDDES